MSEPVCDFRAFDPRDRAAIEAMGREVVEGGDAFVFEDLGGVLDYWFGPTTEVVVALRDGEVAGTYALKPNYPGRGAHVANAGYMVARAFRGLGLGQALCEHSLAKARELGYRSMQFNMVVATNEHAFEAWKKLGFHVAGTLPKAFRHSEQGFVDAYVMFRDL